MTISQTTRRALAQSLTKITIADITLDQGMTRGHLLAVQNEADDRSLSKETV